MGQFCRLCLEESVSFDNLIEIFDDKENPMKISDILNLHFSWLEVPSKINNTMKPILITNCFTDETAGRTIENYLCSLLEYNK